MKIISQYSKDYGIGEDGSIYSLRFRKNMRPRIDKHGYQVLSLRNKDKSTVNVFVHRLVAKAYHENPQELPQVNHKDGNKLNNHISNLEWCSALANNLHKHTVLRKAKSKELYVHFKQECQKYYCLIPKGGKRNFLGYFNTEAEAITAKVSFLYEASDPLVQKEGLN